MACSPARTVRQVVAALAGGCAALVLAAGCTPEPPPREPSPQASLASVPPGMTEVSAGYFAYALPDDWERQPSRYGQDAGVWADADGHPRLAVWQGGAAPDPDASTIQARTTVARYIDPSPEPGRLPRAELAITGSHELAVPRATVAWQYAVLDSSGREHVVISLHVPEREGSDRLASLWMHFFTPDHEVVAQVTETIVAGNRPAVAPTDP